jgi:hypothetical protein
VSAASDRLSAEDYRVLAGILARVRQRRAEAETEAEARERAGEGGEGGEHDAA